MVLTRMALLLMLTGLAACAALAESYPTQGQLLTNPGFDLDQDNDGVPDGWSTDTGRMLLREQVFMGGNRELVSVGDNYVLATQDISLEPGQIYTISFRARGEGGGLAGALIVHGPERPTIEKPLLWRVPVEEDYLTFAATFEAPNPVARLYIYNCSRQGKVSYDWVSLTKGRPDRAFIRQFSFRAEDIPITEPVVTDHTPWARPLSGGPLRAFVSLYVLQTMRELVELGQRIELNYDVMEGGYTGDSNSALNGNRMTQRLANREYEVYLVASRLSEELDADIKRNVQEGAGLVVLSGFGRLERYCARDDLQAVDRDHPLLQALPWDFLPAEILREVRVGQLGAGRVVWLNFPSDVARVWGVWPVKVDQADYMSREMRYWEYWLALIGRALQWAARGDNGVRVEAAPGTAPALRITGAPPGATVDVTLRHCRELRWGEPELKYPTQTLPVRDGLVPLKLPDTDRPDGISLVDVTVRDAGGGALWWGAPLRVETPQAATITGITQAQATWEPGEVVRASVTLEPAPPAGLVVNARLVDAYGRLVAEDSRPGAPTVTVELAAPAPHVLCVGHKLFVKLLQGRHEVDSAWTDVYFPRRGYEDPAQRWHISTWGDGMTNPVISTQYSRMLRELGFDGKFGSWPYATVEMGMVAGVHSRSGWVFWPGKPPGGGVRNPCLSDPAVIEKYTSGARAEVAQYLPYGIYAIDIQDEATLANRQQRYEVCFSEHCQARYRQWLKEHYGDIAALNAEWDTEFASFDEVRGVTTEQIRGTTNFAPFVDFRLFMTEVWVDGMRRITQAFNEGLPTARVGHTNTFGSLVTNGVDYYRLATECGFGWAQEYSEAIKGNAQKAVFELWRSFTPQDFPNYGWIGYDHRPQAVTYEPWWLALHNSRGVTYYATNSFSPEHSQSWSLIYCTQSYTPYSFAVRDSIRDLRQGVGKVLMDFTRDAPDIALLWSHPSLFTAWCESSWTEPEPPEREVDDAYGSYFKSAFYFRLALNELQLTSNYVAPPQIEAGELSKYRVLFLPFTMALSDATAQAIMRWVEAGGTLIADVRLARTDEHGRWRDNALLQQLMGVRRTALEASYESAPVTVLNGLRFPSSVRERLEVVGEAEVLGHYDDGTPAVVSRRVGAGRTVYLNLLLPKYDANAVKLVETLMHQAGVRRPVRVVSADPAQPARAWECATFSREGLRVVGLIRDHRLVDQPQTCSVDFGEEANVFDLRARSFLGRTRTVEATCAPGEAKIYALLPYTVTGMRLNLGGQSSFEVALRADAPVGHHVLHLTWTAPDGTQPWHYESVVAAPGGKYVGHIPLAANDLPGLWTLTVRDVLTNVTAQAQIPWRED